ncbi:unnamed protein product [Ilex paraguariensis]|uniref:Uncharacterized protein n=1 Tax=Ilex paraguariensis TaxID=185542 RepID=A0ABC8UYL2_9AQUA
MMLVLAMGALHMRHRADDLTPKFKSMLVYSKVQHIICTSNLYIKITIFLPSESFTPYKKLYVCIFLSAYFLLCLKP